MADGGANARQSWRKVPAAIIAGSHSERAALLIRPATVADERAKGQFTPLSSVPAFCSSLLQGQAQSALTNFICRAKVASLHLKERHFMVFGP